MLLGEVLIANGFITPAEVEAALARQRLKGGALGENLVALGAITPEELRHALAFAPPEPHNAAETGLTERFLLNLLLKVIYVRALETNAQIAEAVKLPASIVDTLLRFGRENGLVSVVGSIGGGLLAQLRHELTDEGRKRAVDQLERSQYVGPAPVPLSAYVTQVERQPLADERISHASLAAKLAHLVLPARLVDELGPAANSARAMLLYGPPGSGKTSIAEAMGRAFLGSVYVPYAIEIDGQVITVFDPALHQPVDGPRTQAPAHEASSLLREAIDGRWVLCRRPTVMSGGELRLEMLELRYSAQAGLYEAPLQVKAMNGIFLIDDFGRQEVDPRVLLNRWITPLEKRFDFLQLHTGLKFRLPFDVLIVFSTNLAPEDLMDEAFLRRIPYKIHVGTPTVEEYAEIFRRVCAEKGIDFRPGLVDMLVSEFYANMHENMASYHPRFLVERVVDECHYRGIAPAIDERALAAAWRNLFIIRTPRGAHVGPEALARDRVHPA